MSVDFIHLHVHSTYSVLDGMNTPEAYVAQAVKYGMPALAITDHGNMCGAIKFYKAARAANIKPIIGMEAYVAPESRHTKKHSLKSGIPRAYHLVLLAKNNDGYKNLLKLSSLGYTEGLYYGYPHIDRELLSRYGEGLIALSACISGEVAYSIRHGNENNARLAAVEYSRIFKGDFYIEIMRNGVDKQESINAALIALARELNIGIVATNDVHYMDQSDAASHEVLKCIALRKLLKDPDRLVMPSDQFYFRSPDEMTKLFSDIPEAIENTAAIAHKCNCALNIPPDHLHLPRFNTPGGLSHREYLKQLSYEGLEKRYSVITDEHRQRLDYEINIIDNKGFSSYFLVVYDFVNAARKMLVPVGPGRGSASGSLVSYCLGITNLDPIKNNLIFERFLNPERKAMPDIDIDFSDADRSKVIEYVRKKYGEDHVAHIITFGRMKTRQVLKDVARVLGYTPNEQQNIANMVRDQNSDLKKALVSYPELNAYLETDDRTRTIRRHALRLEGLVRQFGLHAAGVILCDDAISNYSPVYKDSRHEMPITQYEMEDIEAVGLLKVDFLGLRNLSVIQNTIIMVKDQTGVEINIETIPLDDSATYAMLQATNTDGVFQLESPGMKNLIRQMQPTEYDDLVALVALYRPGPLEAKMAEQYIDGKNYHKPIRYVHVIDGMSSDERSRVDERNKKITAILSPILKDTYGIILYQEQVMNISRVVAGYSAGEADTFRKAMGKKKYDLMAEQRTRFIDGASKKGFDPEIAEEIFDLVMNFAGYGFNKSHSAAYALVAYQTAYLKANYPYEYMAALMTSVQEGKKAIGDKEQKLVKYIRHCRQELHITVLPPDINHSGVDFTIEESAHGKAIRFGLAAIKNVGTGAAELICREQKNGPYHSLRDFCNRVDTHQVNRRALEGLIKSGAFDCTGWHRAALMESLDDTLNTSQGLHQDKEIGQMNFFTEATAETFKDEMPNVQKWSERQLQEHEKEVFDFYFSSDPLDPYEKEFAVWGLKTTRQLQNQPTDTVCLIGGLYTRLERGFHEQKKHITAKVRLTDKDSDVWIHINDPHLYERFTAQCNPNQSEPIIMQVRTWRPEKGRPRFFALDFFTYEFYRIRQAKELHIIIDTIGLSEQTLISIKDVLIDFHGDVPVFIHLQKGITNRQKQKTETVIAAGETFTVEPRYDLMSQMKSVSGVQHIYLQY